MNYLAEAEKRLKEGSPGDFFKSRDFAFWPREMKIEENALLEDYIFFARLDLLYQHEEALAYLQDVLTSHLQIVASLCSVQEKTVRAWFFYGQKPSEENMARISLLARVLFLLKRRELNPALALYQGNPSPWDRLLLLSSYPLSEELKEELFP